MLLFGGEAFARDAGEACCQARNPDCDESGESEDDIQHLVGVGALVGMEVGLDGVIERKKKEHKSRAAEPREPGAEEFQRGFRTLRTEPVLFVGEIDQLEGHALEQAREPEGEERRQRQRAGKKREENGFGLPAVGKAAHVEARSKLIGQPRIVVRKADRRKNGEQDEQHFGQARIGVQGSLFFQSSREREARGKNQPQNFETVRAKMRVSLSLGAY